MDLLGKVENLLGEVVERVFRSSSEFTPLDLDRSLRQELDRGTKRVLGRVFAPNRVRIHLNPQDRADHRTLLEEVGVQVARSVIRHADHRGWSFLAPFELFFDEDPDLTPGAYRFQLWFERGPEETPEQDDQDEQDERSPARFRLKGKDAQGRPLVADLGGRGPWLVGRDPACDVVLDDTQVSARHARISLLKEGLVIEDLGSTNGVAVNGAETARRSLANGDRVRLGRTSLVLESGEKP